MQLKEYSEELDFHKYWLVLKRRWLPAVGVFGLVFAAAVLALLREDPVYEANGRLLFTTDRASSLVGLQDEGTGDLKSVVSDNSVLDTQAQIIRSTLIAEETIAELNLGDDLKPQALIGNLKVAAVAGTDVLRIAYEDEDPEMATAIVNKVMEVYIRNNIRSNRAEAEAAREFIKEQLPNVEESVSQAEADLSRFKEENGVIVLEREANEAVEIISNLDDQITDAQAELADVSARSAALQRQVGMSTAEAIDVSTLSQSSGVQEALTELQQVQAELTVERTRYQPTHPRIENLQRRVDSLNALLQERVSEMLENDQLVSVGDLQTGDLERSLIQEYVQSEIRRLGLLRRIDLLSNAQAAFEARAGNLPSLEKTQRELERRLNASQTTYEALLSQLQEVQVKENQNVGNARVIEAALVPTSPVSPKQELYLAAGVFAGMMLAIATAFLLDIVDRSVKTVKEGKELFGYTLLGVIPAFGKSGKPRADSEPSVPRIITRDMGHSPIHDAYQMLQANLKFVSSDRELKAIVVTSAVPGEGKSEVSANLAAAIAQVGRRVLLIDADMRNPSLHSAWDLTNMVGLSNVIVNHVSFSEAVHRVSSNLHVLTCGVLPPNPVALVDSKRMASLIENFSNTYDFIIIDTPPLAGFADALLLGRLADGILLVVRPGLIDSSSATAAKELLKQSGQNVLGIVANGVDVKNEPDSYFYYTRDYASGAVREQQNQSASEAKI